MSSSRIIAGMAVTTWYSSWGRWGGAGEPGGAAGPRGTLVARWAPGFPGASPWDGAGARPWSLCLLPRNRRILTSGSLASFSKSGLPSPQGATENNKQNNFWDTVNIFFKSDVSNYWLYKGWLGWQTGFRNLQPEDHPSLRLLIEYNTFSTLITSGQ